MSLIGAGKYAEALEVIRWKPPFPGICGRVRPHPCETACSRLPAGGAVSMHCAGAVCGRLGTWAGECFARRRGADGPLRGRWGAGGGGGRLGAGLACAYQLAKKGYGVTVFEALPVAGGMMAVGIPNVLGKELSYNNIVDLEAVWAMPQEFDVPAVAIIKHTNPSGLATASDLITAYRLAFECDPVSAFGSIIATNREVDRTLVEEIGSLFVEVLAAPAYTADALAWLAEHKKNCRVMLAQGNATPGLVLRSVGGGLLAQTSDDRGVDESAWRVVTQRAPTDAERRSLGFAWLAAKHVKSNAIVLARSAAEGDGMTTVGVGAGQMNRVDSVYLAVRRAGDRAAGSVLGSDAFFPFPDGVEAAAAAGVTAIIQPGGSLRDEAVISVADQWGLAMIFTGERHFRH